MRALAAGLVLFALATAACGGPGATTDASPGVDASELVDGGAGPIAYPNFLASYYGALCDRAFTCCDIVQLQILFGANPPATVVACVTLLENAAADSLARIQASLVADRITYDSAGGRVCVDTVNATACSAFTLAVPDPACVAVLTGQVAIGATCTDDLDCIAGAACKQDVMRCAQRSGAGGSCVHVGCATGLYCGSGSVCLATLADGAPCTSAAACRSHGCSGAASAMTCGHPAPVCPQ